MFKKPVIKLIVLGIVLLLADLVSKYFFYDVDCCSQYAVFEKAFNLGISWSISLPQVAIFGVSIVSLGLFVWMYIKKYFTRWMLAFLLAGTLGNLLDRIFLGGVRDFIQIGNFPVFNIADVWLNVGVGLFVLWEIIAEIKKKNKKSTNSIRK